jgi:glyceraldehyde-3-phosphate dehydrogenase/erythrose-4-phosphate dehydrogenase
MQYVGSAKSEYGEEKMLSGVYAVCVAAQRFFRQAAQQATDSNLRYKFRELANLHEATAQQLPATAKQQATPQDYSSELAAVQFWYLHQQAVLHSQPVAQSVLTELAGLLQQQLHALKQLIRAVHCRTTKVTLAHLSAALQIASDQLQPLLQVLPVGRQNIQTKN